MQSNGVSACMKHFALNNNKINRHTSNPIVDDRTLYEIYLPGFKAAAVEGKAWYFMGGYNLFRGEHASYNPITDESDFERRMVVGWCGHIRLGSCS